MAATEITNTEFDPVDIYLTDRNRVSLPCTLAWGTAYQAGDLLGLITATSLYTIWSAGASDGSQNFVGILEMNADATATGQNRNVPASMGISGDFNNALLSRGAGIASQALAQRGGQLLPNNLVLIP